jgi:hypothetical protein
MASLFFDVLCWWCWLACTVPAATCWTCLTTCCWAGLTAAFYACSAPWCILHLAAYRHEHHLVRMMFWVPLPVAAPAAPSRPASPLAEQQQPVADASAEADAPAATTTTDISSPLRGKAGTKPTRAAPTRSDDGQGLQDTAALLQAPPLPLPSCLHRPLLLLCLRPLMSSPLVSCSSHTRQL